MPKGKRRNYHDDITIAVINLSSQLWLFLEIVFFMLSCNG